MLEEVDKERRVTQKMGVGVEEIKVREMVEVVVARVRAVVEVDKAQEAAEVEAGKVQGAGRVQEVEAIRAVVAIVEKERGRGKGMQTGRATEKGKGMQTGKAMEKGRGMGRGKETEEEIRGRRFFLSDAL